MMKSLQHLRKHKKNAKTPYVLGGMMGTLTLLILGIFSITITDHFFLDNSSLASVISSVLVDLTNSDRTTKQIGGLTVSPVLTIAAQAKADDMAAKSYFAHVSPVDGKNSWYWFQQAGYKFSYAGENLAVDFSDSPDVERAWMNSPTHRANILNEHFTEIGIAVAQGTYQGRPTIFVAQMFGTPAEGPSKIITLASPAEATEPAIATIKPSASAATTKPKVAVAPPVRVPTTTTSARLVLGTEATGLSTPHSSASWWQYVLASPKTLLRYAYYALGLCILLLLGYVTELEFHQKHLRHVGAAGLLLVLMVGLFVLADFVFFAQPVIAALQP
jgi:hypothetical protein